MQKITSFLRAALQLGLLSLVAACGSTGPKPTPAYELEEFALQSPFQRQLEVAPATACKLGHRALLSQGYQVETSSAENVRGSKHFHLKKNHQMRLEITLVCMPDPKGSVIYASALQTRYEMKTSAQSSGVSVAGIGSISLPLSEGSEALIKVGEETVTDPDFYARFFGLLETLTE
jgi:hypothetical protein